KKDWGQRRFLDASKRRQFLAQQRFQEQLFLQPDRQSGHKRASATWRKRQIRLQEPLELHKWFVIKDNVAEIREGTLGLVQAVPYGMAREAGVLFLACKPLFLRCGKNGPIAYQTCGAIMVKG